MLLVILKNIINSLQNIQARRAQCENRDLDPVVWTSHRVIKWIRDIDLKVMQEVEKRSLMLTKVAFI